MREFWDVFVGAIESRSASSTVQLVKAIPKNFHSLSVMNAVFATTSGSVVGSGGFLGVNTGANGGMKKLDCLFSGWSNSPFNGTANPPLMHEITIG